MTRSRIRLPRLILAALLLLCPRWSLVAQGLSGSVVQPDRATPASGVIVLLLNESRDSVLARTTTGIDGRFRLRLAQERRVWLQLLRIGQRPMLDGPHTTSATTFPQVRVVLTNTPVHLAAVNVRDRNACTVRPDSGLLVAQLYEEARKALLASSIAAEASNITAHFSRFTRVEDLRGRQLVPVRRTSVTRETSRPFASVSIDSLTLLGYIQKDGEGTEYRAPDANVLLSDRFVNSHCFELVNGVQDRADFVGVGFRPVRVTRDRVDIRGVMWLHRTRGILESVEFTYDPLSAELTRARVGGAVEFASTPTGVWFVKRWELRMPRHVKRRALTSSLSPMPQDATTLVLEGLDVTGGEVESLLSANQLLYAIDGRAVAQAPVMTAVVNEFAESATRAEPAAAALPPGMPELCRGSADTTGSVRGRVLDQGKYGVGDVRVTATYKEQFRVTGNNAFTWQTREITTSSALGGGYTICGLPLATTLLIEAKPASAKSAATRVEMQLTPELRHVARDLSVNIATAVASFGERVDSMDNESYALPARLQDFDARARNHEAGSFITRDRIVKQRPGSVIQMLRTLSGIAIVDSLGVRRAVSARGRIFVRGNSKLCEYPIVVDNVLVQGLEQLEAIRPQTVYGIEAYTGPASIPSALVSQSRGSWCGLIAIWTIG